MSPTPLAANLCIDFGTAMSKAAIFLDEASSPSSQARARPLRIGAAAGAAHPLMTPSVLFVDQGRILFGPSALVRAKSTIASKRDPLLSFKSILSAQNPADALGLKVRPSIDPTGTLRHRDALTLYLAHLLHLSATALAAEGFTASAFANAPRRYTSPRWRAQASIEREMGAIFAEADALQSQLGDQLVQAEGVSIAHARDALDKAARASPAAVMCVMESHAAAAAHAAHAPTPVKHLLVIDMGAGTTDLAGFRRNEAGALIEIGAAQQTTGLANDEIDAVLVDLLLRKAGKRVQHADQVWRAARLQGRAMKEQLFAQGRCTMDVEGKSVQVRREDLLKDDMLKEFRRALAEACERSLGAVAAAAREDKDTEVLVLLAGGGSHLPWVRDMASALTGARGLGLRVEIFGENWTLSHEDDPALRAALPQIGVALGGALARFADQPDARAVAAT